MHSRIPFRVEAEIGGFTCNYRQDAAYLLVGVHAVYVHITFVPLNMRARTYAHAAVIRISIAVKLNYIVWHLTRSAHWLRQKQRGTTKCSLAAFNS